MWFITLTNNYQIIKIKKEVKQIKKEVKEISLMQKLIEATIEEWGYDEVYPMLRLLDGESDFRKTAINPISGACGLFQAWPCEKMQCDLKDEDCQIRWGINYIKKRYKTPSKAYKFWLKNNWY